MLPSSSTTMAPFTQSTVKIPSKTAEWNIDAWQFLPESSPSKKHAVLIMAHGFGLPKKMSLKEYAERFAAAGYACLVFDYRRWGDSDGAPRHILIVDEQLDDYRSVIKYARQSDLFDPTKVIAWGTSFSGGHITQIASEDQALAAALAQCPFTDGVSSALGLPILPTLRMAPWAILDAIKLSLGLKPIYVPTSAVPGEFGALTTPGTDIGMRKLQTTEGDYLNEISASCALQFPFYRPYTNASRITCPFLLCIPESDNLCPAGTALEAVKAAPKGEFVRVKGGHYDCYPAFSEFETSLKAQVEFLERVVPV